MMTNQLRTQYLAVMLEGADIHMKELREMIENRKKPSKSS